MKNNKNEKVWTERKWIMKNQRDVDYTVSMTVPIQ